MIKLLEKRDVYETWHDLAEFFTGEGLEMRVSLGAG